MKGLRHVLKRPQNRRNEISMDDSVIMDKPRNRTQFCFDRSMVVGGGPLSKRSRSDDRTRQSTTSRSTYNSQPMTSYHHDPQSNSVWPYPVAQNGVTAGSVMYFPPTNTINPSDSLGTDFGNALNSRAKSYTQGAIYTPLASSVDGGSNQPFDSQPLGLQIANHVLSRRERR